MSGRGLMIGFTRLFFWAFTLLTSMYALLCAIPFTWTNFIRARHVPLWVVTFVEMHGVILITLGVCLGLSCLKHRSALLFGGLLTAAGAAAQAFHWASSWGSDTASLWIAFLAWLPYIAWEIWLLRRNAEPAFASESKNIDEMPLEAAGMVTGIFVWGAYGALGSFQGSWDAPFIVAHVWAAASHILLFLVCAASLRVLWAAMELTRTPEFVGRRLIGVLICIGQWMIMRYLVLESIDFRGATAVLYAAVFALATTFTLLSVPWRRAGNPLGLLVLMLLPWLFHRAVAAQDWNKLLESLGALAVWAGLWIGVSEWLGRQRFVSRALRWGVPCSTVALLSCGLWLQSSTLWAVTHHSSIQAVLHQWGEENVSLRMLRRLLRRSSGEADFYAFLQSQTNLSRSVQINPKDITLGVPGQMLPFKPAIFIFVVDSLRPDYLGAYNSQVSFTPQLDAFARESLVFKNAFTVYGATGLSEPSIWSGAHLLHKQYVKPFAPMNTLEKLIEKENYRRYITVDTILGEILKPTTPTDPLDKYTSGNYYFGKTLKEITEKLRARGSDVRPLFVYTQPQDIHISVIQREARSPSTDPRVNGFHAPYASRIAAFDTEFGNFIATLKEIGLYEKSIIVFTSDHGDSLGEGDRWGHAYTIYPEILRVPLILHVPEALRAARVSDVDAPAYLIDISPTLYELLGWKVERGNPLFGRSLLAANRDDLIAHALPERMVVSSYGPVYGILDQERQLLYIADAINYSCSTVPLHDAKAAPVPASTAVSRDYNARIRRHIDALNAAYR